MTTEDDFAIVVGLTNYPNIRRLDGPEQDALEFLNWLTDSTKGGVPKDHIFKVLSSTFAQMTEPTMKQIETEFERLRDEVRSYIEEKGQQARRLYIFLAGHGLSWDNNSAALLTADADYETHRSDHVAGRWYAEWFRNAAYFQEIVLLMDCCRTEYNDTPPRVPWPPENDPAKANVQFFYGFATKAGWEAREKPLPTGGPTRGIFTYALIEGLQSAERDAQGHITGAALSKYIYNWMSQLEVKQEPHIEVVPAHAIVWAAHPAQPVQNRVQIQIIPPRDVPVVVEDPQFQEISAFRADQVINLNNLASGMYTLRWPETGEEQGFDVVGSASVLRVVVSLYAPIGERVSYVP